MPELDTTKEAYSVEEICGMSDEELYSVAHSVIFGGEPPDGAASGLRAGRIIDRMTLTGWVYGLQHAPGYGWFAGFHRREEGPNPARKYTMLAKSAPEATARVAIQALRPPAAVRLKHEFFSDFPPPPLPEPTGLRRWIDPPSAFAAASPIHPLIDRVMAKAEAAGSFVGEAAKWLVVTALGYGAWVPLVIGIGYPRLWWGLAKESLAKPQPEPEPQPEPGSKSEATP